MGCDGGTIPKRDELVKTRKKPEQKDKMSELAFKWKHCAISQETLVRPIVACELGRLYKKEYVLELLLDRRKFDFASQFDHLRGLKDIRELTLTDMPEKGSQHAEKGDSRSASIIPDFICPVVGLEMNGKHRFCFLWSCGCVVSERALKEVKSDTCHKCGKSMKEEDIVLLNGSEEEVAEMREKMELRRALAKETKRGKKAEKHKMSERLDMDPCSSTSTKQRCTGLKSTSQIQPSLSISASGQNKIINSNDSSGSLSKWTILSTKDCDEKKELKKGCIQNDPKASKTFKSLFTSSEEAKNQQQPNWITYNPLYY